MIRAAVLVLTFIYYRSFVSKLEYARQTAATDRQRPPTDSGHRQTAATDRQRCYCRPHFLLK